MTTTNITAIFSLLPPSSTSSYHLPTTSNPTSNCFPPKFLSKQNPRLRVSHNATRSSKLGYWLQSCCSSNAGINSDITDDSSKKSSLNIQLPRRSLLVQFTCDACGEKTKRLINRLAYERGTVFIQGRINIRYNVSQLRLLLVSKIPMLWRCLQHHKLVDNLGLVVEYDLRNDTE
ncbi:Polyphenol oxidase chloroplastic [Bienertia sinuspersici]